MKQVEIKNLCITCADNFKVENVEQIVQRACEAVNLNTDHINLVKVDVGDLKSDQVHDLLRNLHGAMLSKGVDNCIYIPVSEYGIRDITIERIEVSRETV
jgi:hypothetical protein